MKASTVSSLLIPLAALCFSNLALAETPLGGMNLLPGYQHHPLQGIDSVVGRIEKPGGLQITYEIGAVVKPGAPRFGGSFSDRPQNTPAASRRWYYEQVVHRQPIHVAYLKTDQLLVSFPEKGMNLSVTIKTPSEMAEAMLMILSYERAEVEDK